MEASREVKYWEVLNEIAARLQKVAHSETAVYETFAAEIIKHDLFGTISWLDDAGENFKVTAVVVNPTLTSIMDHLARYLGKSIADIVFPLERMPICIEVLETQSPVFLQDNTEHIVGTLASRFSDILSLVVQRFAGQPAIFAPLFLQGIPKGLLYLAGDDLIASDVTAVQALANHLSIALENARLFQSVMESESRFRIVAENVPGVIFLCENDARFTMLYLNNTIEELTGYPKEMFLQDEISFVDLYHPDDAPDILIEDADTLAKVGSFHHIYRIKHRNGEWRWVEEFGSGIYDESDQLLFLEGVITDITVRKHAEEKLQELASDLETQKRFLDAIIATTPEEFVVQDEYGRYLFASSGILRIWNLTLDELVGSTWQDVPIPEAVGAMGEMQRKALFSSGESITRELSYDLFGERIDVEYVVSPVFAENGRVQYSVTTIRDITQRKQEAEAMYHTQKMESLGILAGGVAHDFNNLLVGMLSQTNIAKKKLSVNSPAIAHIEKAHSAAESASNLTRQLLAYSGKGQFVLERINLNKLIQENIDLLQLSISKNVTFKLSLAPDLPLIEADVGQIQQVIMNLIINASEALNNECGTIELFTSQIEMTKDNIVSWQLDNNTLQAGKYVEFQICDDGMGMDTDTLKKIFDPFFTTKFTGRGLGLAAVSGIVRGHRGGFKVSSERGKGTVFNLILPIAKNQETKDDFTMDVKLPKSKKVVLVIDDEAPVRDAVTDILEMEDIEVITAVNGIEGIQLYKERQDEIQVILLDLSMPGLSGEETLQELCKIEPDVQVILSSGYAEVDVLEKLGDNKNIGFLQKPYRLNNLLQEIAKYFGESPEGEL